MGDQNASNPVNELHGDEFWPLSGKPFFDVIITKSNVKPTYRLVIPAKFRQELPSSSTPVVLTFRGKKWEMVYNGSDRIDANWKAFVIDNDLKVGDGCVFEFVKRSSRRLVWRVQILRGDFPSEIVNCDGDTGDAPIVIE